METEHYAGKQGEGESVKDALRAIADMSPGPDTDWKQLAALCITVARIELDKMQRRETESQGGCHD